MEQVARKIACALRERDPGPEPDYRVLADACRASIASGLLPPGGRLPSQRDLATAADMSRTTVVAAYNLLRGEALVETRPGAGTWVTRPPR